MDKKSQEWLKQADYDTEVIVKDILIKSKELLQWIKEQF